MKFVRILKQLFGGRVFSIPIFSKLGLLVKYTASFAQILLRSLFSDYLNHFGGLQHNDKKKLQEKSAKANHV